MAISITAACVSSVTRSRRPAGIAASTSSERKASDQSSGSRSMNSSSMPIVSGAHDGRARHVAHAGTFVMTEAREASAVIPPGWR